MAPVQCKIRFSVGTAKVSAEAEWELTEGGRWLTLVMWTPTPSQGQRETREMMSWVNCGENPGSLPASSAKHVFLGRWCDVIGLRCPF